MTPWVTRLLLANVAVYVVTYASPGLARELLLVPALGLARPWTPITYMFVHAGIWHLAFNMLALFFFGPRLEARLGGAHFLGLYFVSGLLAAAVSFVFTPNARIVGASGAVLGVLLGFARYWPRARLLIWGVFPMEARWLVIIMAALSLFGGFTETRSQIAHFAHLGGLAGGWVYLWAAERIGAVASGRTSRLARKLKEEVKRRTERPSAEELERWARIDPTDLHEVNREHLEEIRAKIEEEGPGSLSQREKDFLDRLSPGASES